MNKQLTVCNIDLHNNYNTSKDVFFDRIKHLEQMRTTESDSSFSYFITSDYELNQLKHLQVGVKTGKIDFLDSNGRKSRYVFAIDISQKIIDWLYKTDSKGLEKQLIAWMSMVYFLNVDDRELLDKQFHKKLLTQAKKLIHDRFSKYFTVTLSANGVFKLKSNFISAAEVRLKYLELCIDYFGSLPVYPLDNPYGMTLRIDDYGVIGPRIHFEYSFMYERDWNTIVLEGIPDALNRCESEPTLIRDWKEVITKYQIDDYHVYNHINGVTIEEYVSQKEGFVYLLSNPAYKDGIYKIGFTTKNVEDRANGLYTTGVPSKFDIEFRMPVNNLRKIENTIHADLKQFRFNNDREFFLGDKDQFIRTIKKYKNLR